MAEDVLRQRAARSARAMGTPEKWDEVFERAFNSTTQVKCQHCYRNTPVPMPDLALLLKVIEGLEGKLPEPEQTVNHNVNVLLMSVDERATYIEQLRRQRESLALTVGDDAA